MLTNEPTIQSNPLGQLRRYQTSTGSRWAYGERFLIQGFYLSLLLETPRQRSLDLIRNLLTDEQPAGKLLPPIDPHHEVWACGVTYQQSREARAIESLMSEIYLRVYEAERPEIFFKSVGWRAVGHTEAIRVRKDSTWNAPEPELTLLVNCFGEITGYCAGNDVCSRDIEGENPLYLPQAKIYAGACALGPGINLVTDNRQLEDIHIELHISRKGREIYQGNTTTIAMKRSFEDLVGYLFREIDFPNGVFLMTGTGIVPGEDFNLQPGDNVRIVIDQLVLQNIVEE